jgi:protein TonB
MRIGFFLLLSLALHVTALSYPFLFSMTSSAELLPVILLDSRDGSGGDGGAKGGSEGAKNDQDRATRPKLTKLQVRTGSVTKAVRREAEDRVEANLIEIPTASEGIAVASNQSGGTEQQAGSAGFASLAEEDVGHGSGKTGFAGGTGLGTGGTGYGKGNGTRGGNATVWRVGVSYAYSPKPQYPHSARKEGREGTVVLRVLVDEEGRSKSLEVNHSSGFDALDSAALSAVRNWRFNPARHGDQRVESWVKIPIVFRLADSKD